MQRGGLDDFARDGDQDDPSIYNEAEISLSDVKQSFEAFLFFAIFLATDDAVIERIPYHRWVFSGLVSLTALLYFYKPTQQIVIRTKYQEPDLYHGTGRESTELLDQIDESDWDALSRTDLAEPLEAFKDIVTHQLPNKPVILDCGKLADITTAEALIERKSVLFGKPVKHYVYSPDMHHLLNFFVRVAHDKIEQRRQESQTVILLNQPQRKP